jgi:ERCC4-related helicase
LLRSKLHVEVTPDHVKEYERLVSAIKGNNAKKGKNTGAILEVLTALRQLVSRAKVEPLAAIIRDMLKEDSSPIVVFVNFRETAHSLCDHLSTTDIEDKNKHIIANAFTGDIIKQGVCS